MKRHAIICDEPLSPLLRRAVALLSERLLDATREYPICLPSADGLDPAVYRLLYIGTRQGSRYIAESGVEPPAFAEGYALRVQDDTVVIAGQDEHGVLYGCVDLFQVYAVRFSYPQDDRYYIDLFESPLPDYAYTSYPAVTDRGIWTWGHVIYDYRRFLENMVQLKLNTLILWNDHAPVNARELVDYAHACGIRLFWGYAWGWDTDCMAAAEAVTESSAQAILRTYEAEYADLGGDGIYFQSFTELHDREVNGESVAEAVTRLVDQTARLIWSKHPELELQFGLHATSVREDLACIRQVDPRIRILWEDCGAFPFSYYPSDLQGYDETLDFVRRVATLRGEGDRFGVVTKGFTKLDWSAFHHAEGPMYIGVSSPRRRRALAMRKEPIWRHQQAYWLTNADKAREVVRCLSELKDRDLYITPLVEDGLLEERIPFPVALFAEMLWDRTTPLDRLIQEVALRDSVEFL